MKDRQTKKMTTIRCISTQSQCIISPNHTQKTCWRMKRNAFPSRFNRDSNGVVRSKQAGTLGGKINRWKVGSISNWKTTSKKSNQVLQAHLFETRNGERARARLCCDGAASLAFLASDFKLFIGKLMAASACPTYPGKYYCIYRTMCRAGFDRIRSGTLKPTGN